MPNSTAADIAMHIVSQGIATLDVNDDSLPLITVGYEPERQNRALVSVYDTGGPASNPAYSRDYPRIQIRTKASTPSNYPSAYNPQQDIKDLILGMSRLVINGTLYVSVMQQGDISTLGADDASRPILISNYKLIREYDSPNGNRKAIE